MSNDAARATAETLSDEAVSIGQRLSEAMRLGDELENKLATQRSEKNLVATIYLETAASHAEDEQEMLREMLSIVKASSLAGAAIQIARAISLVDTICACSDESYLQVRGDVRAINRLLFSALDVVDARADRRLSETVSVLFGNPHLNPWVPVEERRPDLSGE